MAPTIVFKDDQLVGVLGSPEGVESFAMYLKPYFI